MIFGGARMNVDWEDLNEDIQRQRLQQLSLLDQSFYLGTTEDRAYKPWGGRCYKMNEEGETAASPHSSKAATAHSSKAATAGSGVIEIDDNYQEQQVFDVDGEVAMIDLCHEVTGYQEKVKSWMAELPCSRDAVKFRDVFYKSSGNSMWPLVQSGDACTFHPIQAVTAKEGKYSIQKEASEIDVGDIVFCRVQPSQYFYAHIVHEVKWHFQQRPSYYIGNIQGRINGWCYREHIFGILVDVQVFSGGEYFSRPHPKKLFEKVSALVEDDRWNDTARDLCLPSRKAPSSGAQSSGQQG